MYLVTGGAGFIGSNLVHALVARGERVRVLDNFSTGRLENLEPVRGSIELVVGDIRDPNNCRQVVEGVRFILHEAAMPSVAGSLRDPAVAHSVNVEGTLNLLIAARDARAIERFVFASSSSVYGDTPRLAKSESMLPHPQSPYAVSKLSAEHFCRVFAECYGLPTVSLRYFNVYGPRQNPDSEYAAAIPSFIKHCLEGTPAVIYGDATQSRDFTFVGDCVEANLLACRSRARAGEVYNIGSGSRVTIAELHAMIGRLSGTERSPRFAPPREGDVKHSLADISLAMSGLRYAPLFGLEAGLWRTLQWFLGKYSGAGGSSLPERRVASSVRRN